MRSVFGDGLEAPRRTCRHVLLRAVVALFVVLLMLGGPLASCAAPFDPPSLVNSLRIFAVVIDKPFAHPGDTVSLEMAFVDARDTGGNFTPIQIVWLGGCFNPPGLQYYGCYEPLGVLFEQLASGEIPPDGYIGVGPNFDLSLPDDIVSSLPDPEDGNTKFGLAYVFFMACAGEVRPVVQDGDTSAGFFPLGCFDAEGVELGPDGFVPGYTQIYVFDDGRENANPDVRALIFDGDKIEPEAVIQATFCPVTLEERRRAGCAALDEFTECTPVELDIDVPDDIAEIDPESKDADGDPLNEVVWVTYFASGGSFEGDTKLVSDATTGIQSERRVDWVPPDVPGFYQIWAVTRDNRGGSHIVTHLVDVRDE